MRHTLDLGCSLHQLETPVLKQRATPFYRDLPMSEYQYIHFLTCDRPLDGKQLAYMETQSAPVGTAAWD